MVELDKIDPAEGGKDMPPPDATGSSIPICAPNKETRVAAETLKALQGQWQAAGLPENSSLSTPPGEADYFDGRGLMETVRQSQRRQSGVGKQVTSKLKDSRSAGGLGGTKNKKAPYLKPKVPTTHSSGSGSSGGAAGGSG